MFHLWAGAAINGSMEMLVSCLMGVLIDELYAVHVGMFCFSVPVRVREWPTSHTTSSRIAAHVTTCDGFVETVSCVGHIGFEPAGT